MQAMFNDPGAWIALGVSALFLVVGWLMHRVIKRVLLGNGNAGDLNE